ncbi:hypothetical protein B0A49_04179 [Cryomyces minteri]|uniref:Uncharacterized protein n=1 Tax=Cryomyces minteri TaxID=331657 RepID=A0A4U0XK59_9PEZI|nr:hypothetical protein B0A49_04179 [Cryomyces minteri]
MAVSVAAAGHRSVAPKSSYVSDPSLQPFLQSSFDAAGYLNAALPSLSLSTTHSSRQQNTVEAVSANELSTQTQALLSHLNAQASRLSNALTQLTDDILRSGGRLAYEVEVLRGETVGLSDALNEGLREDVHRLMPEGLTANLQKSALSAEGRTTSGTAATEASGVIGQTSDRAADSTQPPHMNQLRTLTLVRSRLESVIQVFGDAMQWTLPPSEVSLGSSLISVSAPETGSDSHSREEKGRAYAEKLRNEILDLIMDGNGTEGGGHEAAMTRIQALRELAVVWRGTAEAKARIKFVDGLARLAEERQRALERDSGSERQRDRRAPSPRKELGRPSSDAEPSRAASEGGYGFMKNLQRIRGDMYLE